MKCFKGWKLSVAILAISMSAGSSVNLSAQRTASKTADDEVDAGVHKVITGLVRDLACPIQHKDKTTSTDFGMDCILACAKAGSPLGILADNGDLYMPISAEMPDKNHNKELMPYLGKRVKVDGIVYARSGTSAIVIKQMTLLTKTKQ